MDSAVPHRADCLPSAGHVIPQTTTKPVICSASMPAPASLHTSGVSSFVGVYQINMTVPQVAAGGALPLQVQIGGLTSTAATTIAVQ